MVDGQEFPYLLIDHNFRCISDVSSVDVSAKTCIFKLKDMIKEKRPSTLDGLDASKFVVWRSINVKLPSSGSERGDLEDHVGSMTFSRENIQELHSSRLVMSYNVPVDEVLLIQVPGAYVPTIPLLSIHHHSINPVLLLSFFSFPIQSLFYLYSDLWLMPPPFPEIGAS